MLEERETPSAMTCVCHGLLPCDRAHVIKPPKGDVIFDTRNNGKTITDPDGYWGPLAKGFGLKIPQDDVPETG